MIDPVTFAVVWAAMLVGHNLADYWLQTEHQALNKHQPGWTGRLLCARHVMTVTITQAIMVAVLTALCGLNLAPEWVAVGLAVNACTHWWIDRRTTLVRLADALGVVIPGGKGRFARLGDPIAAPTGTGAHALDQSWHKLWLLVAAVLISI